MPPDPLASAWDRRRNGSKWSLIWSYSSKSAEGSSAFWSCTARTRVRVRSYGPASGPERDPETHERDRSASRTSCRFVSSPTRKNCTIGGTAVRLRWRQLTIAGSTGPGRKRRPRVSGRTAGTGSSSERICAASVGQLCSPRRRLRRRGLGTDLFFSPRTLALGTSKRQLGQ